MYGLLLCCLYDLSSLILNVHVYIHIIKHVHVPVPVGMDSGNDTRADKCGEWHSSSLSNA